MGTALVTLVAGVSRSAVCSVEDVEQWAQHTHSWGASAQCTTGGEAGTSIELSYLEKLYSETKTTFCSGVLILYCWSL